MRSWISTLAGLLCVVAVVLTALPSFASSAGKRNTAIGLGAASLYELLHGATAPGIVLGAGAAYAYKQYQDSRNNYSDSGARYHRNFDYDNQPNNYYTDSAGHQYNYNRSTDRYEYYDPSSKSYQYYDSNSQQYKSYTPHRRRHLFE